MLFKRSRIPKPTLHFFDILTLYFTTWEWKPCTTAGLSVFWCCEKFVLFTISIFVCVYVKIGIEGIYVMLKAYRVN